MTALPTDVIRWAARAVGPGASVQTLRRLPGATSSALYALDIWDGTDPLPCVLRVYDNVAWLIEEPDIPCLLMTRLPGEVVLRPDSLDHWLHGLAEALLPLHQIPADDCPWSYRPYVNVTTLTPPVWSRVPALWARAIALAQEPPPPAPPCFIHRDYHPNNVLWQNGRVSGIVDWPNACRGVAGVDVAWCRQNLLFLYGVPAADGFLAAYERLAGPAFSYHPHWDLLALMEELPGPPHPYPPWAEFGVRVTAEMMRERVDNYLESVLGRL